MKDTATMNPSDLKVGMYVVLDVSWLRHPFSFNSFVITTDEEIRAIQALGLRSVKVDWSRSRVALPAARGISESHAAPAQAREPGLPPDPAIQRDKEARLEANRALRSAISQAEKQASKSALQVRQATRQFFSEPVQAIESASSLITEVADALLGQSEVMIHLMGDKVAGQETYHHALNVTMLALLLGKALGLPSESLQTIGLGSIFHDIGKEDIPSRVLLKTEPLTHAEEELIRQHATTGAALGRKGGLADDVVRVIEQHHEHMDGSGYPARVTGERMSVESRVVAVANHYDNLCNPPNIALAMTPYEALSMMFAKRKNWFDPVMLGKLVHILGVYPPGSIVQLSNKATGIVVSVNSVRPLKPMVLVHDPSIPKAEALIVDLDKTPDCTISRAIRPSTLAPAVFDYLSPRKRTTYYFGDGPAT
jgi:putative nucleotidyltransferase with HDIG domain